MPRIAIAGFQHETNCFGATLATYADFQLADSWPGLLLGPEVISGTEGSNLPLAGFVRAARPDPEVELIPLVWCSAEPASFVTDDAFERITGHMADGLDQAGEIDAIYLDLHGAMVTQSHPDGEGEILRRLRARVGPDMPIVVSLDLHANVTQAMVDQASAITIFRTYPHLDMADTGGRAFEVLQHILKGGTLCAAFRQAPFLIPLQAQFTGLPPFSDLYAATAAHGPFPAQWAEFAAGFPPSDIHDAGPSVLAYAFTQTEANDMADRLMAEVIAAEPEIDSYMYPAAQAVARAIAMKASRPVVLADVQDNPGAGASSDTTGLLRAMVDGGAGPAALAMLNDPEMAAQAHRAGVGGVIEGALGGKIGPRPDPYHARFKVIALSDGIFPFTGEMYAGSIADTGPTARLQVLDDQSDVHVIVSSQRCQALDLACFTHIGVDVGAQQILAVKSTVHFRADFDPIAAETLYAEAPGLHPCDLPRAPFRHLRPGLRLAPMGPEFRKP